MKIAPQEVQIAETEPDQYDCRFRFTGLWDDGYECSGRFADRLERGSEKDDPIFKEMFKYLLQDRAHQMSKHLLGPEGKSTSAYWEEEYKLRVEGFESLGEVKITYV
jgi:hypothetical protein